MSFEQIVYYVTISHKINCANSNTLKYHFNATLILFIPFKRHLNWNIFKHCFINIIPISLYLNYGHYFLYDYWIYHGYFHSALFYALRWYFSIGFKFYGSKYKIEISRKIGNNKIFQQKTIRRIKYMSSSE